jgi:hypothetical protein
VTDVTSYALLGASLAEKGFISPDVVTDPGLDRPDLSCPVAFNLFRPGWDAGMKAAIGRVKEIMPADRRRSKVLRSLKAALKKGPL